MRKENQMKDFLFRCGSMACMLPDPYFPSVFICVHLWFIFP
jgi:hypothetical protein